ncbi:MAG: PaaI family thioesterase [Rhodospirillales bacterium]
MLKSIAALKRTRDITAINRLIPYARALGLEAMIDGDALVTVLRFRDDNIGNYVLRAVHGGVVGALLEHAAILHLLMETEAAVVPKIVNLSVDYLRPCLAADTFAQGRVIRQGRRVANVRAEAWQDSPARPVAASHAHFLLG